jgi:hypothetical protein
VARRVSPTAFVQADAAASGQLKLNRHTPFVDTLGGISTYFVGCVAGCMRSSVVKEGP